MRTLNGDLLPWRLKPRPIPMPEVSSVAINLKRICDSSVHAASWKVFFCGAQPLSLPEHSTQIIELVADVHSTAFVRWKFKASEKSQIRLKVTYSEGYELEPRSYPFFRTKKDRLDANNGHILGPFDEVTLDIADGGTVTYEPFWFRTFRIMQVEITALSAPVDLISLEATQVNYPMAVKARWSEPGDEHNENIWDVSIRTMRNCMFDGYSDCPFYEQLQCVYSSNASQPVH